MSEPTMAPILPARRTGPRSAWARLASNPVALISGGFIVLVMLMGLFSSVLAPYGYNTQNFALRIAPPQAHHWLGTDDLGRDQLSRLIYGAGISLGVAVSVVGLEVLVGVGLGLVAGYYRGRADTALMRLTDVVFAFPDILLAILLASIVRSGIQSLPASVSILTLVVALGVVGWPGMARLVRGQALMLREKEFIEASRAIGVRDRDILWRHMLPNMLSPIIVQLTQDIANVILAEAILSYLGLGVPFPYPSWGRMIHDALPFQQAHPLLLVVPCLALAFTVMAFNFFGDALRDALDPRHQDG